MCCSWGPCVRLLLRLHNIHLCTTPCYSDLAYVLVFRSGASLLLTDRVIQLYREVQHALLHHRHHLTSALLSLSSRLLYALLASPTRRSVPSFSKALRREYQIVCSICVCDLPRVFCMLFLGYSVCSSSDTLYVFLSIYTIKLLNPLLCFYHTYLS